MTKKTHSVALTQSSALALATGLMVASSPAAAQFNDGSFLAEGIVVEGQAQVFQDIDLTEVVVESEGVVIDWIPFDDAGSGDLLFQAFGTTAIFRDDGIVTDFAVLNRILPTDLSRRVVFDGTVVSELQGQIGGTVFFYSPGGILVSDSAVFDVGNLGLTTAEPVTDGFGNFILGDTVDFLPSLPGSEITVAPGAAIFADQNQGSYVALFAPHIVNRGTISVDGQAALVGGEAGTLTFSPDGLFDIQVEIGSDFGAPIENTGVIGGPASIDGSNRVYMVAISKNSAATISISGGSSLGFDVANSAFMDGDTVVLSAGFNITVGDIDPNEVSDGFLDISAEDTGFGPGVAFTSSVVGQSAGDVSILVRDSLDFAGNATFSGRQAFATLDTNFGTGSVGNLTVEGDLTLLADRTRNGLDVGEAALRLFNGTTANIVGDVRVGSIGTGDGNGDGIASTSKGQVLVADAGSILNVGGNLVAQSSVDLASNPENLNAQGGSAQVSAENQGVITVGGVTRVISDAIVGIGGNAQAGTAEAFTLTGGKITTGELNISADAIAGENSGFGGFSAIAGTARLNSSDAGSEINVLGVNTIGDAALGELDFLSSEAIAASSASTGEFGNGGDATSGNLDVGVFGGAILALPASRDGPLTLINRAIGGDTFADGARGGSADTGEINFQVFDGIQNLGRISILSEAVAGSAAPGVANANGSNAAVSGINLNFFNTDTTIVIDQILLEATGGNGSDTLGGFAGAGFGGNVTVNVDNSTLLFESALDITSRAFGGSASEFANSASTGSIDVNLNQSTVSVLGDYTTSVEAIGGNSLGDQVFDPNFAFSEQGGSANSGTAFLSVNQSSLDVQGDVNLSTSAVGGNALVNRGGNANSSDAFISLQGGMDQSTITAGNVNLTSLAQGGSIDNPGNPDDFGAGGNAGTGRTTISFDGGTNTIDGNVNLFNQAQGGNAGALLGNGGSANIGASTLGASVAGSATVTGDWISQAITIGGNAGDGGGLFRRGGNAGASVNEIFNHGGDVTIGGDATFSTIVEGGSGQQGGGANGVVLRIDTNSNSATQIGGTLSFTATSTGGDSTFGLGGGANGNALELNAGADSSITIGNALQFTTTATAGSSTDNAGGAAFGGNVNFNANGPGASIAVQGANPLDQSFITTQGAGGVNGGGNDGFAQAGFVNFNITGGGSLNLPGSFANPFAINMSAAGGDTNEDDGIAGGANAASLSFFIENSTSDLGVLSINSQSIGGSALPGADRVTGGEATLGSVGFNIINSDVDVGFGQVSIEGIGGNGSNDVLGTGGEARFGSFGLSADSSTLDITTDLTVQNNARGGDGGTGGGAISSNLFADFINSDVNLGGTLVFDTQAFGGMAFAPGQAGGSAEAQPVSLNLTDAALTTSRLITLNAQALGGDAADGDGGAANTLDANVNLSGGSTLTASQLNLQGSATGGSALGMGIGAGGDATAGSNRIRYSTDGLTNVANVNADVNFTSIAQGGDAGAAGGDGGAAISGAVDLGFSTPAATLSISGSANVVSEATGGDAPQGLGGTATVGGLFALAFDGASLLLGSDLNTTYTGRGGEGQTGGEAIGANTSIFVRGTFTLAGDFISNEQIFGGNAFASDAPGAGGNATGGGTTFASLNEASIPTGLVSLGSIDVNSTVTGGSGGNGLNGADGGIGGDAIGGSGTILGRAINGVLEVNGATSIVRNTIGGQGGDGVNGGDGGRALFGGMQIGTASGGSITGQIDGSATFTDITLTGNNVGGDGGAGSTGTGGDGGEAVGGSVTLLGRGGLVTAGTVTFTQDGTGGNGGAGAVQGNGGDGVGGSTSLLITQGLDNQGPGNGANVGSFTASSTGQGGTGAVNGASELAPFSQFTVERSDVTIGSVSVDILGDTPADYLQDDGMGGMNPVEPNPYSIALIDGALVDVGVIDIFARGDVSLTASGGSEAFTDVFEIVAGRFVPSDAGPMDPAFVPGQINAVNSLALTSTEGDIVAEALLASNGDLILASASGITALDLTGSSVLLTLGAGGVLDTGAIVAPGGLISIEAVDDLLAPGTVDAASLVLRSTGGSVLADVPVTLAGDFTAEAALSVNLGEVNASSVSLTAATGDIVASGPINAEQAVTLDAAGGISVTQVNGGSILANAQGGSFFAEALTSPGTVDVEARDTITIAAVDAGIVSLRSLEGFINSTGTIQADEAVEFEAVNGSVNLANVTGGSITGRSGVDMVISGAIGSNGAVDLEATGGGLVVGDVNGGSIALRSLDNNVVVEGGLTTMGGVDILAAGEILLNDAFVGSLSANANGGNVTATGPLNADGLVNLNANGSIMVNDVNAGSITALAQGGSITAGAINAPGGSVDLTAGTLIDLVSLAAFSAQIFAGDSFIANGEIDVEDSAEITAENDVNIQMASARSLNLSSVLGSVNGSDAITVDNDANISAQSDVALEGISAGSLNVASASGGVILNDIATIANDANITADLEVFVAGVNAGSLTAVSTNGDVTSAGPVTADGAALFDAGGFVNLGDVGAATILASSQEAINVGGLWQAGRITLTAPDLGVAPDGALNAGSDGQVILNSRNPFGVLVGGDNDAFAGLTLNGALLDTFTAGSLIVTASGVPGQTAGEGGTIQIDDLDLSAFANLGDIAFSAGETIDVIGNIVSANDLSFTSERVTLNTENGSIDLGTDGTSLTIDAGTFVAGDTGLLEGFNSDLSAEAAQTLINTPSATPNEDGVISAGTLTINVSEAAVIQNVGTEETPAGFVVGSAQGLAINVSNEEGALVILNGQIADNDSTGGGTNVTGDDAATAFFEALGEETDFIAQGSQINACAFATCDDIPEVADDSGELTSTVSASVNGATTASNSGSTTTTTDTDTGSASGSGDADPASGGESSDSGEETGSEEAENSGAGANTTTGGPAAGGDVDVNADNVDDGGGGPGEFDIETSDSSGSDAGGDAGSDAGSGDSSSDSSGETESTSDESSSDEGESSSDEGESSDDSESSDEGEGEDSESEEGEDSEETEEETEEEEEESEEEASEEEEESEGPTTGPINAPPSIINTSTLEQRGAINDPISGSGNPALLDPDVTVAPADTTGGQ